MSMKQRIFDLILEENNGDYQCLLVYLDDLKKMAFKGIEDRKMAIALENVKKMSINEYLATFTNVRVDTELSFHDQLNAFNRIMWNQQELWDYCIGDFDEAFANSNSTYDSMKLALLPNDRLYELPQNEGYSIIQKI